MADPLPMSLAEASDVIRPLAAARLREATALQQIDRALATALTLQSTVARLTKEKDGLTSDIAGLADKRTEIEKTVGDAKMAAGTAIREAEDAATTRKGELAIQIAAEEDQVAALRAKLMQEAADGAAAATVAKETLEKDLGAIRATHEATLADLQRQTEATRVTRDSLTAEMAALHARFTPRVG